LPVATAVVRRSGQSRAVAVCGRGVVARGVVTGGHRWAGVGGCYAADVRRWGILVTGGGWRTYLVMSRSGLTVSSEYRLVIITTGNATSIHRRAVSKLANNDPVRVLGIFTVRSPAVVARVYRRVDAELNG
jgi:hypothetical protein